MIYFVQQTTKQHVPDHAVVSTEILGFLINALNEEPVPQFVPIGIFTVSLALRNPCSNHISLYSVIPVDMFVLPALIDSTISFLYILEPLNVPISFSEVDIVFIWDTECPCLAFRIPNSFIYQ